MNHSTQAHFSQQEVASFCASAVEREEEGGRLLTLSLLAAVSLHLCSLPALPRKRLPANALVSPCSLLPFPGARHRCFLPGLSPSKHTSLGPCPTYVPHGCLVMESYPWNDQIGLTRNAWRSLTFPRSGKSQQVRPLGHAGNSDLPFLLWREKSSEMGILGSQKLKSKAALMHWFSPGKERLFTMLLLTWDLSTSSLLSVWLRVTPSLHILPTFCTKPAQPKCSITPLDACGRVSKSHQTSHCNYTSFQE